MSPLWSFKAFMAGTGAEGAESAAAPINGISIDTRSLQPGDAYFAIQGDVHDGHKFVPQAFEKGASIAVVSKPCEGEGPKALVPDVLAAMGSLAAAARARSKARIAAVTGSVGKTSSKQALQLALGASGQVHVSDKSYNNHWGVPLSLARLPQEAEFAVFEIGMNHPGEITPLVKLVRPHAALITIVAPVHIGFFKSLDEIAAAKAEIFDGLEADGTAVLNRDNDYFDYLSAQAKAGGAGRIISFGAHEAADMRLNMLAQHDGYSCVSARLLGEETLYKLGAPGRHMVLNSLGVLGVVEALGADLALAALALAGMQPEAGRGGRSILGLRGGTAVLIDESYNANPASMRAALSLLAAARPGAGGRRIAVLGDMLELGDAAERLHAELADELGGIDKLFACGPHMAALWAKVPAGARGIYAENSSQLADALCESVASGDVVMIKGSLGSRMGLLAEALKARYPAPEPRQ